MNTLLDNFLTKRADARLLAQYKDAQALLDRFINGADKPLTNNTRVSRTAGIGSLKESR
jgi:hypothetical protein